MLHPHRQHNVKKKFDFVILILKMCEQKGEINDLTKRKLVSEFNPVTVDRFRKPPSAAGISVKNNF